MKRIASLLIVVGLLSGAVSAGRVWVRFTLTDPVLGPQALTATGYDASRALSAVSIVALAAGLVVILTRQIPRTIAVVVLVADAGWACWLALSVLMAPAESVRQPDLAQVGTLSAQGMPVTAASSTVWVWVFLGAAVAIAVGCLILVIGAMLGSARLRKTRRRPSTVASSGEATSVGATSAEAPPTTAPEPPTAGPSALSPAEVERRANAAAWNELSEGKDPTAQS